MHLFHEKRIPTDAISIVLTGAKNKDFVSVEVVDAATECFGCGNAFRQGGAQPLMAVGLTSTKPLNEDQVAELAQRAEEEMKVHSLAATESSVQSIPPIIMQIVTFIIQYFLNRKA